MGRKKKTAHQHTAQRMEINNMTVRWRGNTWELQLICWKMAAATAGCPWQHLLDLGSRATCQDPCPGVRTSPGDHWPCSCGAHLFLWVKAEPEVGPSAWPDAWNKPGNPGNTQEPETHDKHKLDSFRAWLCKIEKCKVRRRHQRKAFNRVPVLSRFVRGEIIVCCFAIKEIFLYFYSTCMTVKLCWLL